MNINDALTTIFLAGLQLIAFVAFAPFLTATIRRTKARLQSRRGPGLLQPYRDLAKWWGKLPLESSASGPVARYAPAFVLGSIVAAVLLVPWATARTPLPGWGDLLVLVGLFALARFALALAALDTGSAFGGMGSSRDVAISALAEPGLVMALAGVAIAAGTSDLGAISAFGIGHGVGLLKPAHLLEMAAFALVVIAETGHHPVDNPDTHLELTMIHEGMLIEASGRSLATLVFASELKLAVLAALFSAAFLPFGAATEIAPLPIAFGLIVGLGKMLVVGQALALLDGSLAKARIMSLPDLLGLASLLALSGLGIQVLLP
ncbi:MAG TPA: NADH-quinone oxidoreductase subunit H [Candidatus Limnocylindrales bacterium]